MKRAVVLVILLAACNRAEQKPAAATPAAPPPIGNAEHGRTLVAQYGCNVCHTIPGIEGPQGTLGPALQGVASRPSISNGAVKNSPEHLSQYIQNPASLNPQSTMPALGLPPGDANDIAAFLLTLK
jgi:cytochrome c2